MMRDNSNMLTVLNQQVNLDRFNSNLVPIQSDSRKLTQFALEEADRSATAGELVQPEWRGFTNAKTIVVAFSLIGHSTVKDLLVASNSNNKYLCFILSYFELKSIL